MNIAFVTEAMPDPNGYGSQRRAAQHIRALVRLGPVTVFLPWTPDEYADLDAPDRCRALGATDIVYRDTPGMGEIDRRTHAAARGRLARAWRGLRRRSYLDVRVQPQDRASYRDHLVGRFDLIFTFKVQSAIWVDSVMGRDGRAAAKVADFDDIESHVYRRLVVDVPGHTRFWRWKLRRLLDWLRQAERSIVANWTKTCVCSEIDADRVAQSYGKRPWVVPNGYRFGELSSELNSGLIQILFVGTFGYGPNVEAALWFVRNCWPLVRAALGEDVSLNLVGFTPPPAIAALDSRDGVCVTGDAPDIDPFYASANIVIAPLFEGSGTRIKLIEAAAQGRAMVTTALGCEGLDFVDGVHAEIADTAEDFAGRIVALARDPARRARLAEAALRHARERFDTERVECDLAAKIRELP